MGASASSVTVVPCKKGVARIVSISTSRMRRVLGEKDRTRRDNAQVCAWLWQRSNGSLDRFYEGRLCKIFFTH